MPVVIGVDVGGTNTDAVAIDLALSQTKPVESILSSAKIPTTFDVSHGINEALNNVIGSLSQNARDDIVAVNIGTTHFINAVIEKDSRKLAKLAVLRLSGPYGAEVPPFAGLPDDLRQIVEGFSASLPGGLEIDGRVITPLDEGAVRETAEEIRAAGIKDIAVIGVYSPIDSVHRQEDRVAEILHSVLGEGINVTLSHNVAGIGFIERENATILNATILPFARKTIRQFQRSIRDLKLSANLFLTKNDGTLINAEDASSLPVSTFLSGPTNSLTGAVFLANIQDRLNQGALVLDIGGTTSDVCAVEPSGLPRPAAAFSHLAGVRTNFSVSNLRSIGVGGGSIVQLSDLGDAVTVGPQSVGKELTTRSRAFGGQNLTTTDILVAGGLEGIGDKSLVSDISPSDVGRVKEHINRLLERVIDEMKTTETEVPVILVGGGSILCSERLKGVSDILRPPFAHVANAVGAAMARVSGLADTIVNVVDQDAEKQAVSQVREQAILEARRNGAETPEVVEETILPVLYTSTRSLHIIIRAVGKLSTTGFKPRHGMAKSLHEEDDHDYENSARTTETANTSPPSAGAIDTSPASIDTYRPKITNNRWILSQIDLDFIAEGCAILGCGGGGDIYASHLSVKKLFSAGRTVEVISPEELPDAGFIPAVAVMGSPSTFSERLPSGEELKNSINAVLKSQSLGIDDLTAVMSLEIGGSNGMRGIQAALWTGKPLVDADLMGRAYPNLWQVTPNNAGIFLTPAAASDGKGNTIVQTQASSNRDIEDMLRAVCVQMGQAAGISLGALTGRQVKKVAAHFSISLAWRLGRAVQLAREKKRDIVVSILDTHPGKKILTGKITSVTRHVRGGFTEGSATIVPFNDAESSSSAAKDVRIIFQNENIHVFRVEGQVTLGSVPDLICLLDAEDGRALGTQDYRYGLRVHVVVLAGSPQWTQGEGLKNGGPKAFGLDIEYIPIAESKTATSVFVDYST